MILGLNEESISIVIELVHLDFIDECRFCDDPVLNSFEDIIFQLSIIFSGSKETIVKDSFKA